jgi:hypothetical protein
MTAVLGNAGQVASLVLLLLGVAVMYAAVLLLWRPPPSARPRSWAPWLLLAGGAAAIFVGRVGL